MEEKSKKADHTIMIIIFCPPVKEVIKPKEESDCMDKP